LQTDRYCQAHLVKVELCDDEKRGTFRQSDNGQDESATHLQDRERTFRQWPSSRRCVAKIYSQVRTTSIQRHVKVLTWCSNGQLSDVARVVPNVGYLNLSLLLPLVQMLRVPFDEGAVLVR
jgi:hypothetical protein